MFCPRNKPKSNQVKIQVAGPARCLICKKNSTTVQYKSEDTVKCVPHSHICLHYSEGKANSGCSFPSPQREEVKLRTGFPF